MRSFNWRGIDAKMDRAGELREGLQHRIIEHFMLTQNCPSLFAEKDESSDHHIFRISSVPTTLDTFVTSVSIIVGDIINNLRASLDHLAYQLALRQEKVSGRRPPSKERRKTLFRLKFPIHSKRAAWSANEKDYHSWFGKDDAAIIKSFQPFRGRAGRPDNWSGRYHHPLTLLAALSNQDKHRLLILNADKDAKATTLHLSLPHGVALGTIPLTVNGVFAGDILFGDSYKVKQGAVVMRHPLVGDDVPSVINNIGFVVPGIAIRNFGPVLSEMDRLHKYASEVMTALRAR
jgi:hypothetical protein